MKRLLFIAVLFLLFAPSIFGQGSWTRIADISNGRLWGIAFSAGGSGYFGLGSGSVNYVDLWRYDTLLNTWSQRANFPGPARDDAGTFVIGDKGYVMGGEGATTYSTMYEYNSTLNSW